MDHSSDGTTGTQPAARRGLRGIRGSTVLLGGALLGLVGLLVVGYGTLALRNNWFPFHSEPPREVSLEEARRRFVDDGAPGPGEARPFTPTSGVYEYEGTGSESLSNPPRTQQEGPLIPGTVTYGASGCWSFRLDYSSNHWRRWDFCVRADELVQVGTEVSQRWDFGTFAITNLTTMTCEPPGIVLAADMVAGDEWPAECRGENTQISGTTISTGTHRLVGIEQVVVAGIPVDAYHFRDERRVTGSQSGVEQFDFWFSAQGLVLKGEQQITIDSDSPLGNVTYTQEGMFALVGTTPRT